MGDPSHEAKRTVKSAPAKATKQAITFNNFAAPQQLTHFTPNFVAPFDLKKTFSVPNTTKASKGSHATNSTPKNTTTNHASQPKQVKPAQAPVYGPTPQPTTQPNFFKASIFNLPSNPYVPKQPELLTVISDRTAGPSRTKMKLADARNTLATYAQREGSFYELVLRTSLLNAESKHLPFRKQVNTEIAQASKDVKKTLGSSTPANTRSQISKQLYELEKQDIIKSATFVNQAARYRQLSARSSKFVEQMYVPNQGLSALAGYGQCIDSINKLVPTNAADRARFAKAVALLSIYDTIAEKSSTTEARRSVSRISNEALAQNKRIEKRLPQNQKHSKELDDVVTALCDHPELAKEFIKTPAAAVNATPTMFRADLMLYIDRQAGGIRNSTLTKDKFETLVRKWNNEHLGLADKQVEFSAKEFDLVARQSGKSDSICRSEFEEACAMTLPDIDSQGVAVPGTVQPVRPALGDRGFVEFLKSKYAGRASAQTIGMNESEIRGIVGQWNLQNPASQVRFDSESARLFNLWSTTHVDAENQDAIRVLPQGYLVRADHEVKAREKAAQDRDAFLKHRVYQELEALRDTVNAVENGRDVSRLENKYDENLAGEAMWALGHVSNFALNSWDTISGAERGSWKLDNKLSQLKTRLENAEAAASKGDVNELAKTLGLAYQTAGKASTMLNDHVQARDMVTRVTRTIIVVTGATVAASVLTPFTAGTSWVVTAPIIASTASGMVLETSLGALEAKAEGREYTDFQRDLGMGGLSGFGAGVFAPAGKAIDVIANNASTQVANVGLKGATAQFLPGVTKVVVNSTLNGTASAGIEGITAATEGDFDHIGERMWSAGKTGLVLTATTTIAVKGFVAAKDGIKGAIATRRVLNGMSAPQPQVGSNTINAAPKSYISADGTLHGSAQPPIIQFNSKPSGLQFGQADNKFDFSAPATHTPTGGTPAVNNPNFYTGPVKFVPPANLPQQIDRWIEYSGRGVKVPSATPPLQVATPELPAPQSKPLDPSKSSPASPLETQTHSTLPQPNTNAIPSTRTLPSVPKPVPIKTGGGLDASEIDLLRGQLHDPVHGQIALKKLLQSGTAGHKVLAEELKQARKVLGSRSANSRGIWQDFLEELPANAKLSPELLDALRSHKMTITGSLSPRARKAINQALEESTFIADRSAIPELTKRLGRVRNGDSYRAAAALSELGDDGVKIVLDRIESNGFLSGSRAVGKRIDALRGLGHAEMKTLSDANQVRLVKAVKQVSKEATAWYSVRNRFARSDAALAVAEVLEKADPAVKKEIIESAARLLKSNKAAREAINLALTNAAKDSPELRDAVAAQMVKRLRNGDPNIRKSAYENLGKIGTQQGLTLEEITALERRTHAFRWGMPAELRRSGRKLAENSLNDLTIIPKNGQEFSNKEVKRLVNELGDPQLSKAAGKALASQPPANVAKQLEYLLNKDPFVRTFGVRDLRRAQIEACETLEQLVKQHGVDAVLTTGLKRRLKEFTFKNGNRNLPLRDASKAVLQTARAPVATP